MANTETQQNIEAMGASLRGVFYDFSKDYWQANCEFLHEGVGMVCMLGVAESQLVSTTDREAQYDSLVSVIFDARQRNAGKFIWQVTQAQRGGGRTIDQYTVLGDDTTGISAKLDRQGRLVQAISREGAEEAVFSIAVLLESPLAVAQVDALKGERANAIDGYEKFKRDEAPNLFGQILSKQLKSKEDQVSKIGFTPLKPYEFPKAVVRPAKEEVCRL